MLYDVAMLAAVCDFPPPTPWPVYLTPFLIVGVAFGTLLSISWISGWSLLARRFRATEPFVGERWNWQSLIFRGWCGYNNCVTVGASPQYLYLSVMRPFKLMFHPPLLIPWNEISVECGRTLFGLLEYARLRIGTSELVTLRIQGRLVARVRQAAGTGWPLYRIEEAEARMH
jgi:hypothetical protein